METVDSSIVYQKNWKTSYLPLLWWVLSLKNKIFRPKFFRIRLIQKLGVSFDCSKMYKNHFWPRSEKTSRFNFCRVWKVPLFFEFWIYQSSITIHCLIFHRRRVCCAFSNVFSTKILNIFFGNSRFEHSVPKKLQRHFYRCYCGSYLWKIKFSGKILLKQANSENGCSFRLLETVQNPVLTSQ